MNNSFLKSRTKLLPVSIYDFYICTQRVCFLNCSSGPQFSYFLLVLFFSFVQLEVKENRRNFMNLKIIFAESSVLVYSYCVWASFPFMSKYISP